MWSGMYADLDNLGQTLCKLLQKLVKTTGQKFWWSSYVISVQFDIFLSFFLVSFVKLFIYLSTIYFDTSCSMVTSVFFSLSHNFYNKCQYWNANAFYLKEIFCGFLSSIYCCHIKRLSEKRENIFVFGA